MNIPADEHCVRAAGPLVETAGPDAADPPERLLRELARVADLLRSSSRLDAEAMTAVVRLVPGLDLPRWQSISGQCDGWFALPLRDKERPVGNSPTADERDAITGMWRAAAFTERLTSFCLSGKEKTVRAGKSKRQRGRNVFPERSRLFI